MRTQDTPETANVAYDYYKDLALSYSGLKEFAISPAHYQAYIKMPKEQTAAMRLGTLTHLALLEPEVYAHKFVVAPEPKDYPSALKTLDDLKLKCKELGLTVSGTKDALTTRLKEVGRDLTFWDDIVAQHTGGKELLTPDDRDLIEGMVDAIQSHSVAFWLFTGGEAEKAFKWTDPLTSLVMKCKPDYLKVDQEYISDLKTVQPDKLNSRMSIERHVYDSKYHWQSGIYCRGISLCIQKSLNRFAHVFVGNKPTVYQRGKLTHVVRVFMLDDAALEKAEIEYQPYLESFAKCVERDEWPCFPEEAETISLPTWAW